MELEYAVGIAAAAGRCPAAFICGRPPRIAASVAWTAHLTRQAFELWKACRGSEVVELTPLVGFPTLGADGQTVIGLLVVASAAAARRRAEFVNLVRLIEHTDASLLSGLVERLKRGDPEARADLIQVLRKHNYNLRLVARSLGISRPTLYKYLRDLRIPIVRVPAAARADDEFAWR